MKMYECPVCRRYGLKIELDKGYHIKASGRPLKEFDCVTNCIVCKRKIKYTVEKDKE